MPSEKMDPMPLIKATGEKA